MELTMENLPGDFFTYDRQTGKFGYISSKILDSFGCSEKAFRDHFYNSFDMLIYKQDRKNVKDILEYQAQNGENLQANFRIKSLLDEVMFVEFQGRIVKDSDGREMVYSFLYDVTEMVEAQREVHRMNEELFVETQRYKLLQEALDDLPFDYDVEQDSLMFISKAGDSREIFLEHFVKEKKYKSFVFEKDIELFESVFSTALEKPMKDTIELRAVFNGEEDAYCWYRCYYASFQNSEGKILRIVGNLKDIALEKHRQEEMRKKIRTDALTGILNKAAMEVSIQEYLKSTTRDKLHALLMIDTDNFKAINDTFGHQYGDEAIKFVADVIRKTFRESDFVGRVGGDEFMVFMKNTTKEVTEARAQELNQAIRRTFEKGGVEVGISCSIGVAYYPKAGTSFEELFANADEALYSAKETGKNKYVIFS